MPALRVLVIDDEPFIRQILEFGLKAEGFEVLTACDGADGLAAARRERPDCVVCDIMMPEVDGYSVCRELKGDADTRGIPVVLLSAKGSPADIESGFAAGCDDYVTKPFSPRKLTDLLRGLLVQVPGDGHGDAAGATAA